MDDGKIIRELAKIFGVPQEELPKTIERFKTEVQDMEKKSK